MKGLLVMSIKLLPCDYADSEMIVAWLNRESKKETSYLPSIHSLRNSNMKRNSITIHKSIPLQINMNLHKMVHVQKKKSSQR